MSSNTEAERAPIDPEKGGLDNVLLRISLGHNTQKVAAVETTALSQKKDAEKGSERRGSVARKEAGTSRPPAKPRRKVPRWVQFRVWFNTYRCV